LSGTRQQGTGRWSDARGSWRLLYDGRCRFCQWTAWAILQLDTRGVLEPLTFDEAVERGTGTPPGTELHGSWHLLSPEGERWSGGEAIPHLARLLLGRAAAPLEAQEMRLLERRVYGWLTRHRGTLSRLLPPAPPVRRRAAGTHRGA
jgi:predicted DCC family thiol-disulfide oxidoreductase YuxK